MLSGMVESLETWEGCETAMNEEWRDIFAPLKFTDDVVDKDTDSLMSNLWAAFLSPQ